MIGPGIFGLVEMLVFDQMSGSNFRAREKDAGPVRLELQAERELADANVANLSRRAEG